MPRGAVSGELIAGIEPIANTIEGIEQITRAGAFPTVCIMAATYDACRRHRIPIGLTPNIEVSLVVNPDDAALLAPRRIDFYKYEAWRRGLRIAGRPVFRSRLRPGAA